MEHQARTVQRHVRLHRNLLQSTATSLKFRLGLTSRIRSVATRDANRLISRLNEVKKSWTDQSDNQTFSSPNDQGAVDRVSGYEASTGDHDDERVERPCESRLHYALVCRSRAPNGRV